MNDSIFRKYLPGVALFLAISVAALPLCSAEKTLTADAELNRVLGSIKEKEKSLKTFSATFRQTRKTYLFSEPLLSEGRVFFDASGMMLMKMTRPSPMSVLFKSNALFIYYPEVPKVEKRFFGNAESIFKTYFGIGQTVEALKEAYEIQIRPKENAGGYFLHMTPKQASVAKHIEHIEVAINPETLLPETISFAEVRGDQTVLRLHFETINQPLPPDIFSMPLPESDDDER